MYHAAKLSGHHIKPCHASIPKKELNGYSALVQRSSQKKVAAGVSKQVHHLNIMSRHSTSTKSLQGLGRRAPKRKKSSLPSTNTEDWVEELHSEGAGMGSVSFSQIPPPSPSPYAISSLSSNSTTSAGNNPIGVNNHPPNSVHPVSEPGHFFHQGPSIQQPHYVGSFNPTPASSVHVPTMPPFLSSVDGRLYHPHNHPQSVAHRHRHIQLQKERNGYSQQSLSSSFNRGVTVDSSETSRKNIDHLTTAIAELVICDGLNFNFAEKVRFMNVLKASKRVNLTTFTPPNRNAVSGHLLDINYQTIMETNKKDLVTEANTYGIAYVGDGATVRKLPLCNMLGIGVHCPPAVLEICDSTNHMQKGGKKDARFIARRFIPIIKSLDPTGLYSDLVFFDGAHNVQNAGRVLEVVFPRMTCLKGVEHCVALIFSDLAKIPVVKDTILRQNRMYVVFSSGIFHAAHATFKGQSKSFNNGREIGLLRASPTRMAGHFYAMMRALRCRCSLRATVNHSSWAQRKKKEKEHRAGLDVMDDVMWKRMYVLCKALLPCLILLRIADRNSPGMDMLKYYVDEFQRSLKHHQSLLDDEELFPMDQEFKLDAQLEEDQEYNGVELEKEQLKEPEELEAEEDDNSDESVENNGIPQTGHLEKIQFLHNSEDNSSTTDDQGLDDDDSVSSAESQNEGPSRFSYSTFSGKIMHLWNKREEDIVSDYSLAGWMCCVLPIVRKDCREFMCIDNACHENKSHLVAIYRNRVSELVRKLFGHLSFPKLIEAKVDTFWVEWKQFHLKLKPFDRDDIWDVPNVAEGRSHMWHDTYSLHQTEAFGFVACRTTSKVLGIGSAERSWGDVKHLRDGKRCNIGSGRLEKQAVCYTHSCLEKARIYRELKCKDCDNQREVQFGWEEMDKQFELQIDGWIRRKETHNLDLPVSKSAPLRIVKAYVEQWEIDHIMCRNDASVEQRYLSKYAGLHFYDPDEKKLHVIQDEMRYISYYGWHVTSEIMGEETGEPSKFQPWSIIEKINPKTKKQKQFPIMELVKESQQPKHLHIKMFLCEEEFDEYNDNVSDQEDDMGIYEGLQEGNEDFIS